MFEQPTETLDRCDAVERFRSAERVAMIARNEQLVVAASWPDRHPTAGLPRSEADDVYVGERAIRIGGSGTPLIAEFAIGDLAVEAGWSIPQMRLFMADAVDVRFRFPQIFDRVRSGLLPRWTAQKVARETRSLSVDQAARVEAILLPKLSRGIRGQRLDHLINATMIIVDPERFEQLAEQARRTRYFRTGQSSPDGISEVWARLDAPDAIRLKAMVHRIAEILRQHPGDLPGIKDRDASTAEEWEAVALGVLANPVRAAQLLIEHEQPDLFDDVVDLFAADNNPSDNPADNPSDNPSPADDHDDPALDGVDERVDREDHGPAPRRNRAPEECRDAIRALLRAISPAKLLPPITFHVHCTLLALQAASAAGSDDVARLEEFGPITLTTARRWFGGDSVINLKPVVDPDRMPPVDAYEVPAPMRAALLLRNPLSRFPHSNSMSARMEDDHTIPYRRGRPHQTGPHNLGPLATAEHRYKTFARIDVRQPEPDLFIWRSRYGRVLIVDATGTHDLGTGRFAQHVWSAAVGAPAGPIPRTS